VVQRRRTPVVLKTPAGDPERGGHGVQLFGIVRQQV
jgi:hypothetical protein